MRTPPGSRRRARRILSINNRRRLEHDAIKDDKNVYRMRTLTISLAVLFLASSARAKKINPRDLSIEELVGQTFMIAIDTGIAAAREADIRSGRLGGAMLR